jgi:hypothetical protein
MNTSDDFRQFLTNSENAIIFRVTEKVDPSSNNCVMFWMPDFQNTDYPDILFGFPQAHTGIGCLLGHKGLHITSDAYSVIILPSGAVSFESVTAHR